MRDDWRSDTVYLWGVAILMTFVAFLLLVLATFIVEVFSDGKTESRGVENHRSEAITIEESDQLSKSYVF